MGRVLEGEPWHISRAEGSGGTDRRPQPKPINVGYLFKSFRPTRKKLAGNCFFAEKKHFAHIIDVGVCCETPVVSTHTNAPYGQSNNHNVTKAGTLFVNSLGLELWMLCRVHVEELSLPYDSHIMPCAKLTGTQSRGRR